MRFNHRWTLSILMTAYPISATVARPLTIEDVLSTISIDKVSPSPNGRDIAVVLQRPVHDGEVAGRVSYEIDATRSDVWLLARDGSAKQNLTNGERTAAGFWCPEWSPDGNTIAMLSTMPEGEEPRGGDAVRLYLWDAKTHGLIRASDRPMKTQTRYGSPINTLDVRGSSQKAELPQSCRLNEENAPFTWLDNGDLLVVQMPEGENSAIMSPYARDTQAPVDAWANLRGGRRSTAQVFDTDRSRLAAEAVRPYMAEIATINVSNGTKRLLASVPAFPFRGMLSVVVSPNEKSVAILTTTAAIPPAAIGRGPINNSEMSVEKRLGIVALNGSSEIQWYTLPPDAQYPLDLSGWSFDSDHLAFRARKSPNDNTAKVFLLHTKSGRVTGIGTNLITDPTDAGPMSHDATVRWRSDRSLLIFGRDKDGDNLSYSWWEVEVDILGGQAPQPAKDIIREVGTADALVDDRYGKVWQENTAQGSLLKASPAETSKSHELLVFNSHLKNVKWGEIRIINYVSSEGKDLKALLYLPPNYDPAKRYPLLTWLYPGTIIENERDYWSDPFLPGFYNLNLYAAHGYAVVVPSMPLIRDKSPNALYSQMSTGVIPAIDKVISLGIADPARVGAFGQSFGGYAVYALVTQLDRFKAAAAISGMPNLATFYSSFDPTSLWWPNVGQDRSENHTIAETALALNTNPIENPIFYFNNSPITFVKNVSTPLLIAHGTIDSRGSFDNAEQFFDSLNKQGKTSRLLVYEGEGHSISTSPENVRHLFREMLKWFDEYLMDKRK